MANYIKPQIPLRRDDNYIYPLTSVDQIVTEKGRLINEIITVDLSEPEFNLEESKVNVDLLGGRPANDFLSVDVKDAETGELYPIYAENGIYTYAHTAGTLSGQGVNGKFKATVDETISSIVINGVSCVIKNGEESSIELIKDCWYTFILDGNTINFKSGGSGLGNSKLALATATEADVLSGKTFYAGDKELKTGTLDPGSNLVSLVSSGTANMKSSTVTLPAGKYQFTYTRTWEGYSYITDVGGTNPYTYVKTSSGTNLVAHNSPWHKYGNSNGDHYRTYIYNYTTTFTLSSSTAVYIQTQYTGDIWSTDYIRAYIRKVG